jgi:hypothetical protein
MTRREQATATASDGLSDKEAPDADELSSGLPGDVGDSGSLLSDAPPELLTGYEPL